MMTKNPYNIPFLKTFTTLAALYYLLSFFDGPMDPNLNTEEPKNRLFLLSHFDQSAYIAARVLALYV